MKIQKTKFQSRIIFEIPNFDITNTKDRKAGIRCYTNPVAIFFLKLFGRIVSNKSNTIHINKSSLNKWLNKYRTEEFLKGFNLQTMGVDGLINRCKEECERRKYSTNQEPQKNMNFGEALANQFKLYGSGLKINNNQEHPILTVMLGLLKIFDKEGIQGKYRFDSNTGEFSIKITEPAKYWLPSVTDILKKHLPKGIVFLFANNEECEILGKFDKVNKKIIFEKGFQLSATYGWFTNTATIEDLFYSDKGKLIVNIQTPVPGFRKIPALFTLSQFFESIDKREKVNGDHYNFLKKK